MTTDDPGLSPDGMLTLTEAAAHTGYTREALRQRIRRGSPAANKGNDGMLRIHRRDLDDLPPPDQSTDDQEDNQGQAGEAAVDAALAVLTATVVDLRADLIRMRTTLDTAQADRLVDHGRAAKAEAHAAAEAARATTAEARLAKVEAALAEARTPWAIRVIGAWRSRGRVP